MLAAPDFRTGGAVSAADRCPLGCGPLRVDPQPLRDNRFGLPYSVRIGWCESCGLGVTLDPPSREELSRLYQDAYVGPHGSAGVGRVPRTSRVARLWHRINGSLPLSDTALTGPVLDVGCHTGELTLLLVRRGLEAVGLEPNPTAAALARAKGLEVIQAPVEEAEIGEERFGTILLSQVLEHVHDPHLLLLKAHRALRRDGSVHIVVPNAESGWRRLFGRHWVHWHVPFHLFHFTEESLRLLCEQSGLTVTRAVTRTPGEWLLMSTAAWKNARKGDYRQGHFSGRYVRRLLVAPPARVLDALHRGDAIVAEAVRASHDPHD